MKSISDFHTQESLSSLLDTLDMNKGLTITLGSNLFYSVHAGLQFKAKSTPDVYENRGLNITTAVNDDFDVNQTGCSVEASAYATNSIYRVSFTKGDDLAVANECIKNLSDLICSLLDVAEFKTLINTLSISEECFERIEFSEKTTSLRIKINADSNNDYLDITTYLKQNDIYAIYFNGSHNSYLDEGDIANLLGINTAELVDILGEISSFFQVKAVA